MSDHTPERMIEQEGPARSKRFKKRRDEKQSNRLRPSASVPLTQGPKHGSRVARNRIRTTWNQARTPARTRSAFLI